MRSMNWIYWGVIATFAMMLFEGVMQGLGLTRMSIPFMVGTLYTPNRSRAKLIGAFQHVGHGLLFTLVFVIAFHLLHRQTWWLGGLIGLFQGMFVLVVGMSLLPEFHPRMASERSGPTAMRQLEPPGFMALNYGPATPISIIVSHVIFGIVIGSFCNA